MNKAALFFLLVFIACKPGRAQDAAFESYYNSWMKDYQALNIPETELSYQNNFTNIGDAGPLAGQEKFFSKAKKELAAYSLKNLSHESRLKLAQLSFETAQNLERTELEKSWIKNGRTMPQGGLYTLRDSKRWYAYYIRHFTGRNISPEDVFKTGEEEVKKAQQQIANLMKAQGFDTEDKFYAHLSDSSFFLRSKAAILAGFKQIDSTVRSRLPVCFQTYDIPVIEAMEWPGATASTPPGIYLSKADNPYGVDVFQFNFSTGRYNTRCMDWLYLHEAIPGHHLQSVIRGPRNGLFYFGTSEGWACYVEDLGTQLGLYADPYRQLGLHEWNLVRSARLVMEVGIHYYGWRYDKAMSYWKDTIKGQDAIAAREINRITNWPGQALCYKIGALTIKDLVQQRVARGESLAEAHHYILQHSALPLQALVE